MKHLISENTEEITVEYSWDKNLDNKIKLIAKNNLQKMLQNSDFEFITEHYFGYTKNGKKTFEYEITHPKWKNYEVLVLLLKLILKKITVLILNFYKTKNHILFYWQKVLKLR